MCVSLAAETMNKNSINFILLFFAISILFSVRARSDEFKPFYAKRGYVSGDYIIGALIPFHKWQCETIIPEIDEYNGVQIAEAAFFAVDLINRNEEILPNVTLGINIREYCNLKMAISQSQNLLTEAYSDCNETRDIFSMNQENIESPLIGIIGPDDIEISEEVQRFLSFFGTIQVQYSVPMNHFFENKFTGYHFFYSVLPGNYFMTEAIFDILVANNWTYVSLVYSEDSFGEAGLKNFMELAPEREVCIAGDVIDEYALSSAMKENDDGISEYAWNTIIMPAFGKVDVIVCYCSSAMMDLLYDVLKKAEIRLARKFVVIVGDEWPLTHQYQPKNQEIAVGEIRLSMKQAYIKEFDDYYLSRNLENNKRNPWFVELWQEKLKCQIDSSKDSEKSNCSGNEVSVRRYKRNPKVPYVIESIFILAQALHNMLQKGCDDLPMKNNFYKNCYWESVANVNFDFYGQRVAFNRFGNILNVIIYDIHNFQLSENGSYHYIQIGEYKITGEGYFGGYMEKEMEIKKEIILPLNKTFIKTTCNAPCSSKHAKVLRMDKCCWDCVACGPLEILKKSTQCVSCAPGSMSNSNKTDCISIPMEHIEWYDAQTIFMVSVSLLCIILTAFVSFIFIKHQHTPVVKSSTKELCYIMFVGMFAANLTFFVTIPEPSVISCIALRILPAISFTLIYAALFVKTNRIARLLAIEKKKFPKMNPKFLSLQAQVIFTIILIVIEAMICLNFLYKRPIEPENIFKPRDDSYYGVKICPMKGDMLLEVFAFVGILIIICTYYAFKTRNLPENFKEAKYIGFAMYATILTDVSFGFIYAGSDYKILAINLCISINTLVVLIFLFAPKLYIILWIPERNTRANFTTSKNIRCFIANEESSSGKKRST